MHAAWAIEKNPIPELMRSGGSVSVAIAKHAVVVNAIAQPCSRRATISMTMVVDRLMIRYETARMPSEAASSHLRLNESMAGAEMSLRARAV